MKPAKTTIGANVILLKENISSEKMLGSLDFPPAISIKPIEMTASVFFILKPSNLIECNYSYLTLNSNLKLKKILSYCYSYYIIYI